MKRFLKKSWHRIPVGVITAVLVLGLVAGGVLAALPNADQTITQAIEAWNYGSITAPSPITLLAMKVGETYNENEDMFLPDPVTVVVGEDGLADGAECWLHMSLDQGSANLYDVYKVILIDQTFDNPMGIPLVRAVWFGIPDIAPDKLEASIQLTAAGTYTFQEAVAATAGNAGGTANVIVTFTLEDEA